MEILKFNEEHIKEASLLFKNIYDKQKQRFPLLPNKLEIIDNIESLYKKAIDMDLPRYVALENDKVIGFMMGFLIDEPFKGKQNGIFIPEWGHSAHDNKVTQFLFNKFSSECVKNKYYNIAISIFSDDDEALDFWFKNVFGMLVIDCIRGFDSIEVSNKEVIVKSAQLTDIEQLMPLVHAHQYCYPQAPIFLPIELDTSEWYTKSINSSDANIWIAWKDNKAVGYIIAERNQPDAYIFNDDKTLSVKGAYVVPEFRGKDIASVILSECIEWAKQKNFQRITVDFESANTNARKFWLRHFNPVCISLIRHIDDRI